MRKLILGAMLILSGLGALAQGYSNPVIPGFHPDPSICRVGDDYYLVNSTFEFFPGVPVFHSKDLVSWKQIGYCLTRNSQLPLGTCPASAGIYAPTIRYNNGVFYMVTTNVGSGGNFYVYTTDPAGEWSEPIYLKQQGIDPSFYFEGDKCYMVSNPDGITLSEIDIKTGKQLTESKMIWRGTGGRYPEGPHIYKKDGWYYLLISEGGTEYGHKVTIARSKSITGPYEANPANPILTHINEVAQMNPIQGTGHADIIEAHDGSWWVVFLGFRPQSYLHHLLGRETYLAPVTWEKGKWPVVNGGKPIELQMTCPTLPLKPFEKESYRDDFNGSKMPLYWNYKRNPFMENYSLSASKGSLRLKATAIDLDKDASPTFVCRRQQHIKFEASTALELNNAGTEDNAGLSVYMRERYHYDAYLQKEATGATSVNFRICLGSLSYVAKKVTLSSGKAVLRVVGENDYYTFFYSEDGNSFTELGKMDTRFLSSETAGGFTGIMLGLFAVSNNEQSSAYADFDWFDYQPR